MHSRSGTSLHLPGTVGIWTFVFMDMLVFLTIFAVFMSERLRLPEIYAHSQRLLNAGLGLANTFILLTSSWLMVTAVEARRRDDNGRARQRLLLVLACGGLFCLGKAFEYHGKYEAGLGITTNSFFSFYYFMTGLHLLHVIGGMIFIAGLRGRLATGEAQPAVTSIENVGLFWHVVDVLWIYIFSLVYLVGVKG